MNIAVILTKDMQEGGAFQYALSVFALLEKNRSDQYNFVFFTTLKHNIKVLKGYGLAVLYLPWSDFDRFLSQIYGSQLINKILKKLRMAAISKFDKLMERHGIDLAYFLSPTDMALAADQYNYIFTVWDLCFLEQMEFPEVRIHREFERRNKMYQLALRKAIKVIADSDTTKKNIVKRYAIDEERVLSLPFLPFNAMNISDKDLKAHYIDIKGKYRIKENYIFYPAQFWPHKNHIYILEGLKLLKEKHGIRLSAVFTGSDKGNLNFVLDKAKKFGIDDQIYYIGFVEDKELPYIYIQALALVMPTYFGPTNIPPLEAFKLGCPVMYSDLPGLNEQIKDAALLLDLKNPESLCRGLLKVIGHTKEVEIIINNGKKKIEALEKMYHWPVLKDAFDDYNQKMKCWK